MTVNQHFDEMEYFDETYEVIDDLTNKKRKLDEIWEM